MRDLATTTISLHSGVRPPAALTTFIKVTDPVGATRQARSPETYAAAYERGARMSLDEAVARVAELGDVAAGGMAPPGDASG